MKRILTMALLVALAACEGAREGRQDAGAMLADMTVREIGDLAGRIFSDPGQAEELLESAGISLEALDSLAYEIASDSEATAEYLRGLGDASD